MDKLVAKFHMIYWTVCKWTILSKFSVYGYCKLNLDATRTKKPLLRSMRDNSEV